MTTMDSLRHYEVPAVAVTVGMMVDDARFRRVMRVGHVGIGRKWVSLRSFHPEARIYPNTPIRIALTDTVTVVRSTIPATYWGRKE